MLCNASLFDVFSDNSTTSESLVFSLHLKMMD